MLLLLFFIGFSQASLWAIETPAGTNLTAFAIEHGLEYQYTTSVNENISIFKQKDHTRALKTESFVWFEPQIAKRHYKRGELPKAKADYNFGVKTTPLDDPLYDLQWHLHGDSPSSVDANASAPLTGRGITLAIVDDGFQHTHPELASNYDAAHSWNLNGGRLGNRDPMPQSSHDGHGTSAASVAGAAKNNGHCGRGVAPEVTLVGIRLIADAVTDAEEAEGLAKEFGVVDIYSNSWGPADTGYGMDSPGRLARETFARYAAQGIGRKGKGTIYVWASGNGRDDGDTCAFDGYAGNPYVNAIGALDFTGKQSYYSEGCANLIAVTPSSGAMKGIVTGDLLGAAGYDPSECTMTFGGTSSAAPLAAGIIALLLEKSNNTLSWRDVKHVIARGATKINPQDASWHTNSAGYHHSNAYGFGLLKIPALLHVLETYTPVPSKQKQVFSNHTVPGSGNFDHIMLVMNSSGVTFIEMVILKIHIQHPSRGKLSIVLRSPAGTESILADFRPGDHTANYPPGGWSFSSLHFWGENIVDGTWDVFIRGEAAHVSWVQMGVFGY